MENKIKTILEDMLVSHDLIEATEDNTGRIAYDALLDKTIKELVTLGLPYVSKCYSEKDMDNAYDKGFKDGNQRDRE